MSDSTMSDSAMSDSSTIAAIATPAGTGGIAVIRISGPDAIKIVDSAWKGKNLTAVSSHTAHLGKYISVNGDILDEAVVTVFRAPNSFTGEDVVELSVHGSRWIQRQILSDLIARGVTMAAPGEFTQRAFLNGRMDLAQAEGVADLIAASSKAAHSLALNQTSGAFSGYFKEMRQKLIDFASLLELELDFSEEDVEFADRSLLSDTAQGLLDKINHIAASFQAGNAIKEGVPVVIAGIPNAGKSSLLNLILQEDKAIVSAIPGTTRDTIEDTVEINGILFRIIDTAGLRNATDEIEKIGIERAIRKMKKARIILWIIDPTANVESQLADRDTFNAENPDVELITILGKSDISQNSETLTSDDESDHIVKEHITSAKGTELNEAILFSAKTSEGLDRLKDRMTEIALQGLGSEEEPTITNMRHFEALMNGADSMKRAIDGIRNGLSADLIAQDVRETIHHLGSITGSITTTDLLHTIFSRFCIGK